MPNPYSFHSHFIIFFIVTSSVFRAGKLINPLPVGLHSPRLRTDRHAIEASSTDYGNLVREIPAAVLHPSSVDDIINLIKLSNNLSTPFPVAARGCGHSVRGQATARGGVVVDMNSLRQNIRVSWDPFSGFYADVGGEQRWIDVLEASLQHGLTPVSWTDYLNLSVGGTLSNGGISGQSFLHGPQISNVLEMDVITGKGEFMTCSKDINSELFHAVLGGLGQFGIITRARIVLQRAPLRAKWMRLLYNDFSKFIKDQEHLISRSDDDGADYVEGSLISNNTPPNNWRSSFFSDFQLFKIFTLSQSHRGPLYSIEVVKYYNDHNKDTIEQELDALHKELNFIPGFIFMKDVSYFEFLTRVGSARRHMTTHPWLNLFVPKSRILDFSSGVLMNMIGRLDHTSGPILIYPFNRKKWDAEMSAVTPDEDIFYTLGLLHESTNSSQTKIFDELHIEILKFCEENDIKVKQYLPHYRSREDWIEHFGEKWKVFQERKRKFDPKMILSPGQRIFNIGRKDDML